MSAAENLPRSAHCFHEFQNIHLVKNSETPINNYQNETKELANWPQELS